MAQSTTPYDLGPLPKKITGSCLCGAVSYQVDYPENYPFEDCVRISTHTLT
jgi:hypothetical protein